MKMVVNDLYTALLTKSARKYVVYENNTVYVYKKIEPILFITLIFGILFNLAAAIFCFAKGFLPTQVLIAGYDMNTVLGCTFLLALAATVFIFLKTWRTRKEWILGIDADEIVERLWKGQRAIAWRDITTLRYNAGREKTSFRKEVPPSIEIETVEVDGKRNLILINQGYLPLSLKELHDILHAFWAANIAEK